jgi:hypothetical protein
MMKKSLLLPTLFLFLVLSVSCNTSNSSEGQTNSQDSLSSGKAIQLTNQEKAELNSYFTCFSEIHTAFFKKDNIPDSVLIRFGVYYNYRNHFDKFKQLEAGAKASIGEKQVADTAVRFFGAKIIKHQAIEDIEYKNNSYIIFNSDGEAYRFSQIRELTDTGQGIYDALIEIFSASSGFTGDINSSPEKWKSSGNEEEVPTSEGKIKAKIKKIEEQGKTRYILLEYLSL